MLYPFAVVNPLPATIGTLDVQLHADLRVLFPLTVEHFLATLAANLSLG